METVYAQLRKKFGMTQEAQIRRLTLYSGEVIEDVSYFERNDRILVELRIVKPEPPTGETQQKNLQIGTINLTNDTPDKSKILKNSIEQRKVAQSSMIKTKQEMRLVESGKVVDNQMVIDS